MEKNIERRKESLKSNEDKPVFVVSDKNFRINNDYIVLLSNIKQRFKNSQIKAAVRINDTMIEFYWSVGSDIVEMQSIHKWGSGVIKQLSLDLRAEFPDKDGFSVRNLEYMKKWYLFYREHFAKSHQVGSHFTLPKEFSLVPWRHHVHIAYKCKSFEEAMFYIHQTIEQNWSRKELEDNISDNLYIKQGKALRNFNNQLSEPQSKLAQEILKDPYNFEFLSMKNGYNELQLEEALINNITRFLLELGVGFAFVGRQMELKMSNGKSFFPDLVFYHIKLKSYVVIELKVVDFLPEFIGKLNFYVSAADELLRSKDDNPSIGLLICKSKDRTMVEWAFRGINTPIGVAEYQLQEIIDKTTLENSL